MTAVGTRRRPAPAALLLALTILAQIAYPLVAPGSRGGLTAAIVLLAATTTVVHAALTTGTRAIVALCVVAVVALCSEAVGVATGFPFGAYRYAGDLGPQLLGVPWLVAAAWVSMAWPAAVLARRVVRSRVGAVVLGAWALTAWDVFLDPQMVAEGHWTWTAVGAHLPGVPAIPLTNFAGWLLVSLLISLILQAVPPPTQTRAARIPLLYYGWTAASSTLAAAAFWDRPAVALWGLLAMGPPAVAGLRTLNRP